MKYLNNYDTLEEANQGINMTPNVSVVEDQLVYTNGDEDLPIIFFEKDGKITSKIDYSQIPLTFKGTDTENSVQLKWNNIGYSATNIELEVSINDGDWRPYEITDGTGEIITLSANDTVKFRGNNETLGNVPPGPGGYWQFFMTGTIEAHGNIMSLLDKSCERLDVPTAAFIYMFSDCTSLTTAPELPATTLANNCYNGMFRGCTSLTTAPELPTTTLADGCYGNMFQGCTSLTTAPELPTTTLTNSCYVSMFQGCTSLTTAPELPATTLASYCYADMFNGCSVLTELTVYANDISASDCVSYWLVDTALNTTGTLINKGSATYTPGDNIPSNWIVQSEA